MDLSKAALSRMFPHAKAPWLEAFAEHGPRLCAKYQVTTPRRFAHFVAQLDPESAGLTVFEENLHYNPKGLAANFGKRVAGREHELCSAGPDAIACAVYDGRLGNTAPGDGAKYKGRGPIQLTGKANHAEIGAIMGIDLVGNPKRLLDPPVGLESAFAFWQRAKLNAIADTDNLTAVRKRVNGGTNGLDHAKTALARAKGIWGASMVPADLHPETEPHEDAKPPPMPTAKDLRKAGSRPAWMMSVMKWIGALIGIAGYSHAPVSQFLASTTVSTAKDASNVIADTIRDHDAILGMVVGNFGLIFAVSSAIGLYFLSGATHIGRYTPIGWLVGVAAGRIDPVQSFLDSQTIGDAGSEPSSPDGIVSDRPLAGS